MTAAGVGIAGRPLDGELEAIVEIQPSCVDQELNRLLFVEREVNVDVLGRTRVGAEAKLECETSLEHPRARSGFVQPGKQALEDHALP